MGELVQETSQDSKTAERASSAASATSRDSYWPAHSLGKPDGVFNSVSAKWKWNSTFRLAACNPSVLQQRHLDFSSCFTASITLHHWLSKQTDVPVKSSYHDYDFGEDSTPPLAVQLNGCAWEGLCSLKSLPFRVKLLIRRLQGGLLL